jgi:hypothetical protein
MSGHLSPKRSLARLDGAAILLPHINLDYQLLGIRKMLSRVANGETAPRF